jgi:hypothetical protein
MCVIISVTTVGEVKNMGLDVGSVSRRASGGELGFNRLGEGINACNAQCTLTGILCPKDSTGTAAEEESVVADNLEGKEDGDISEEEV